MSVLTSAPKKAKYVPKHRAPGRHKAVRPRTALRTTVVLSGVAAVATGVSVSGGVVSGSTSIVAADIARADNAQAGNAQADNATPTADVTLSRAQLSPAQLAGRPQEISRSDRRGATDPTKAVALSVQQGVSVTRTEDLSNADPREIAKVLLPEYGFSADQFSCLDSLYVSESNWRVNADNPTSSAYGIPQALTSMHDLPADYMTSAESQIRWGLEYIKRAYGTPCNAWGFKQGHNWY